MANTHMGNRLILIWLIAVVAAGTCCRASYAQVSVEISSLYSAVHYASAVRLPPGEAEIVSLEATPYHDRYTAVADIRNSSLRLIVIDSQDILAKNPSPRFLLDRSVSAFETIALPQMPSDRSITAAFKNESPHVVELRLRVFRHGERPSEARAQIKKLIEIPITALDMIYILPRFKVSVQPCGFINAFSTPNVIICTELIADLFEKKLSKALTPILMHELAHSLLYLWGFPGHDNEDMADEFAAAFLATHSPELIDTFVRWLESQDSVTQAVVQLVNGDRHTISIQRARNMKATLSKPDEILRRWARLLGPHQKQKRPNQR